MYFSNEVLNFELAVNDFILHVGSTLTPNPHHHCPLLYLTLSHFCPLSESPGSDESPAESLRRVVVNGNGSVGGTGTDGDVVLFQNPEGRQLSPLTSPLLTDAGCVRNDEDEDARRKVGVQTGGGGGALLPVCRPFNHVSVRHVE